MVLNQNGIFITLSSLFITMPYPSPVPLIPLKPCSCQKLFLNAKVGDSLRLNVSKIFKDENELHKITGIEEEKLNEVDEIDFKINELNKNEKAETNNDFFKKVYPNETIKSLNEFKNKIKEDIEKQFVNQSDQKFLNDVTDSFIKETKISLPEDFLKRLMKLNSKEEISNEDLEKEYSNSENGIKYQLIEEKLLIENNIQINADSIKEFATKMKYVISSLRKKGWF